MGFTSFFKWIEEKPHGYKPIPVYVSKKHTLIVDFKGMAYGFACRVPLECEDFAQEIANQFIARFGHFAKVTFVNDGKIDDQHPKYETSCKRKMQRQKDQEDVTNYKRSKLEHVVQENEVRWVGPEDVFGLVTADEAIIKQEKANEEEKWNKREARSRGVDFETSLAILEKFHTIPNFDAIQCHKGEADPILIAKASEYDFVVSEDSDILIGGVNNFIRNFANQKQALYRADDILDCLKLTKEQLQEIACVAGNDYRKTKIKGMGVGNAYTLISKYKTCARMIQGWEFQKNKSKFVTPPDLLKHLEKACLLYNPNEDLIQQILSADGTKKDVDDDDDDANAEQEIVALC